MVAFLFETGGENFGGDPAVGLLLSRRLSEDCERTSPVRQCLAAVH